MIKGTNLNIRVDKSVKEQSEKIFEELGLNMSTAINMFLRQVIRNNGIPFELKTDNTNGIELYSGNKETVKERHCIIEDIKKVFEPKGENVGEN